MTAIRFWVVSPEGDLRRRWRGWLAGEGWEPLMAEALSGLASPPRGPGLLLLDWAAAGGDAVGAIRRLKRGVGPLTLILASDAELEVERVIAALEAGADDHFPFTLPARLFLAKVRAHLRRLAPYREKEDGVLQSPGGEIRLDRSRRTVSVRVAGGRWRPVPALTPTEIEFLMLFLEQPGRVLARAAFLETVWQDASVRPGTVDKHVESLRKKLGRQGDRIRTIYGVGYALKDD